MRFLYTDGTAYTQLRHFHSECLIIIGKVNCSTSKTDLVSWILTSREQHMVTG